MVPTETTEAVPFSATPEVSGRGNKASTPFVVEPPPHGINCSSITTGTPASAVPTFPRKENELVIMNIVKTLNEASVKLETDWLEREKRQRQVEAEWLESTMESGGRQRQDELKYLEVIKSQQREIQQLHHLRDEDRMEIIKKDAKLIKIKAEIMTLHVTLNKRKRITTELEENNPAVQNAIQGINLIV